MNSKSLFSQFLFLLSLVLVLFLASPFIRPFEVLLAQEKKKDPNPIFNLPPRGAPGPRSSAGGRSACPEVQKNMTAILPRSNFGYTLNNRPSLLIYIPYQSTGENQLEIELRIREQEIKKISIDAPHKTGIFYLPFPSQLPDLNENQPYRWILTYTCETPEGRETISVSGGIMKVQLSRDVTQKINSADFEEKLRIYGEEGIWYDLITELAKRKMSDPQNIDVFTLWSDLLNEEDVDLSPLSNENIYEMEE